MTEHLVGINIATSAKWANIPPADRSFRCFTKMPKSNAAECPHLIETRKKELNEIREPKIENGQIKNADSRSSRR